MRRRRNADEVARLLREADRDEERSQMQERFAAVIDRHESPFPVALPQISRVNAASGVARSRFVAPETIFSPGFWGHRT